MPVPSLHELASKRAQIIHYLKMKIDEEDWRAVVIAAMELGEIEAQIKVIQ